jgi:2-phosphoglycerate kinase
MARTQSTPVSRHAERHAEHLAKLRHMNEVHRAQAQAEADALNAARYAELAQQEADKVAKE